MIDLLIAFLRRLFAPRGESFDAWQDRRLARLAQEHPERLNYKESVVDLMKLLGMDSSLENRRRLAKQYGYQGVLAGTAEMNMFLHREIKRRL